MFRYLPEQASEVAHKVDFVNNLITDLSVFFTVAIVGSMIYFAVRYRKKDGKDHETPQIHGNNFLEMVWTVVPTIICVFVAWYGVVVFKEIRHVPEDALEIGVMAQKWKWDFEYENGKKTVAELVVPVNRPIKMVMKSRDVLHSFFVPAMRVKMDVIPGRYTYVSFKPIKTGEYNIFCTEYCGKDHWNMLAKLKVVSGAEYDNWLNDNSAELALASSTPAERGGELYVKNGCNACHSLDGTPGVGPSFLKLYGREGTTTDGQSYKADHEYLQESILYSTKRIVQGYQPVMPAFEGQLNDDNINDLIAFIKAQDGTSPAVEIEVDEEEDSSAAADRSSMTPAERGELIYKEKICVTCHSLDGTKIVGPSFKGVYGRSGTLESGESYTADDAYIKKSILEPQSQVVKGFAPAMPPYAGQLNDDDISDIIEFLKTVK
ncbi:MAG: cytochrome c oxidase subunit II [Bdellovibrionales bacterium]|nr:cytochrome c oxidase subunit II [Bdellovibrionales bacterium]